MCAPLRSAGSRLQLQGRRKAAGTFAIRAQLSFLWGKSGWLTRIDAAGAVVLVPADQVPSANLFLSWAILSPVSLSTSVQPPCDSRGTKIAGTLIATFAFMESFSARRLLSFCSLCPSAFPTCQSLSPAWRPRCHGTNNV